MKEIELDIAWNAGYLVGKNEIVVYDSRDFLLNYVPTLAKEFYNHHLERSVSRERYMEAIDNFCLKRLKKDFKVIK